MSVPTLLSNVPDGKKIPEVPRCMRATEELAQKKPREIASPQAF
jgi:hypothetical protein